MVGHTRDSLMTGPKNLAAALSHEVSTLSRRTYRVIVPTESSILVKKRKRR